MAGLMSCVSTVKVALIKIVFCKQLNWEWQSTHSAEKNMALHADYFSFLPSIVHTPQCQSVPSASAMFAIDDQNMQTNVVFQDRMVKME